jgi:molybdopterin-containing oxidoreductase family iron-sulfur binding subunit
LFDLPPIEEEISMANHMREQDIHSASGSVLNNGQTANIEDRFDQASLEAVLQKYPQMAVAMQRNQMDRRTFLKVMGASLALVGVGLQGCSGVQPPNEEIIPYVRLPEEIVPGVPLYFASSMVLGGYATGVLIETHEGRPARIEGNPKHPASLGGCDVITQASILELYNPNRSIDVRHNGELSSWDDFLAAFASVLEGLAASDGAGLRILTETITSPSLASQFTALLEQYPGAKWYQYDPVAHDNLVAGSQLAFDDTVNTVYDFASAAVVVSLDADFMSNMPGSVRYAYDFMQRRRVREGADESTMNRLYSVESTPTITGATADHHLALRPSQIEGFARALAAAVGVEGIEAPAETAWDAAWFDAVVADLQAHTGSSAVIAGFNQPPVVHALVHAINLQLENVGTTVRYIPSAIVNPTIQTEVLPELFGEMMSGAAEALIIIGGNPVFNAAADIAFADALTNVPFSVHLSLYNNETSALCTWHIPQTHYIEEWGDARAFDGSVSLVQPPIGPLYNTVRSAHELLALLAGDARSSYDIVRGYWETQAASDDFDSLWRRALHDGVMEGSAPEPITPALRADFANQIAAVPASQAGSGLEIIFRPDPSIWDGRFADNSWLQELPEPLTALSWDNAALISPATAERLGLSDQQLVELSYGGRTMQAPILTMQNHPDDAVTISLGYGRGLSADVDAGLSFNAYAIRTSLSPWFGSGLEVRATGGSYTLATVRAKTDAEAGEAIFTAPIAKFVENPEFVHEKDKYGGEFPSLLPMYPYTENAWGMTIDLSACIGCNACIIGCQTENNIPTVGKEGVRRSREMYWIRIDRYYVSEGDTQRTNFQPVPCMHCETAPCELVCPVQATVHSAEGLNQMVYNRCIGTRYCSANCPYGVRRFNFFDNVDPTPILEEVRNPDVSVRVEGVMEKCTYCTQRISAARIEAKREGRPIRDGDVVPACASACPTKAIIFGNINDPQAAVTQAKAQPHNYGLLAELNTVPRTTYLAHVYNPNESLDGAEAEE